MKSKWKGALIGSIVGFIASLIFIIFSNAFGYYFLVWIAEMGNIICNANECIPFFIISYILVYIFIGLIIGYLWGLYKK